MAKTRKDVQISHRDVYELKLGDREPILLSEDEVMELYSGLTQSLLERGLIKPAAPPSDRSGMQAPAPSVVTVPAEPERVSPVRRETEPVSPEKRRRNSLVMAGIVVIVVGVIFAGINFTAPHSVAPSGPKVPPPAPYEHFDITAGVGGNLDFNGSTPGPSITAPNNTYVWLSFTVASDAGVQHSWVLVPSNVSKVSAPDYTPVFAGASTPDPTAGSPIGSTTQLVFKVDKVGSYIYICEVPGHFEAGMWGWFNVTASNTTNATSINGPLSSGESVVSFGGATTSAGIMLQSERVNAIIPDFLKIFPSMLLSLIPVNVHAVTTTYENSGRNS